jgi:hypothetical protein
VTTATGAYATAAGLKARTVITDTTDDTVIGTICDQVNQYVETKTRRVLAPISSATYTFDGDGSRCLRYPRGIRAVSLLECQLYTTAGYSTIPSTQYFLRPSASDVLPGWPFTRIEFTDYPLGTISYFPRGFDTVRVTMTTGWAAIPDDITDVALTAATRAWHAVQAGQTDIIGTDDMGRPLVSRFFSARDLETLNTYSSDLPA